MTEISCTGFAGCPNRVSGLPFPSEDIAASAAGTKRKDNLRFSFLFELLPFPWRAWVQMVDCVSVEKENGRGFFLPRGITPFRISDNVLLHLVPRLRGFTHICSTKVSDTAYRQRNGQTHWSAPTQMQPHCRSPLLCLRSLPSASKLSKGKRKIHKKEETVGFLLFVRLRQYSPPGKSVPLRGSCAPESECQEKPPSVSQPITQFLIPA